MMISDEQRRWEAEKEEKENERWQDSNQKIRILYRDMGNK